MPWKIPKEHYHRGLVLCWRNARRLLKLSNEAFEKDCFHAAYLLGFASWEEIGKAAVLLNHWDDVSIKYEEYRDEIINHEIKITEAEKLEDFNLLEILSAAPRKALIDSGLKPKVDTDSLKRLLSLRLDSIYVDYNFKEKCWDVPFKEMKKPAVGVIIKAAYARAYLHNELKYRGIRLRKKQKRERITRLSNDIQS